MLSSQQLAAEYNQRASQHRSQVEKEQRRFRWIGNLRLLAGISAAGLAFFVFGSAAVYPLWLALPLGILFVLVAMHARVVERLELARRTVRFYERGLARLSDQWMGTGEQGERFRNPNHIYADDLDLFGKGSLYELLCTARTRAGEDMLAGWLLAPSEPASVMARQAAIAELAPRLDLRQELALIGEDVQAGIHPDQLPAWGEAAPIPFPRGLHLACVLLSAGTILTLAGYLADLSGRIPLLLFGLAQLSLSFALRPRVQKVIKAVDLPSHDLALISALLSRIEREPVESPLLTEIKTRLKTEGLPASVQIARLERLVNRLEWSHNEFFKPIAALLMWSTHLAASIEIWRQHSGPAIQSWIAVTGEFEALTALATYRSEHPSDLFPELSGERVLFDARDLGHPLLPEAQCVRNDVHLGADVPLLVISGSNMSGKSTLLRTVGLNAVLAWAGAPVRARSLVISRLRVAASIRVQDSLQDGRSRFYAEITRLRQIVELTNGEWPVLFLVDELLSGTNSHDREIGAAAIVRSLVDHGAIGLLTTHDLALAHIANLIQPPGANVHFVDTVENGSLHFDYRLHPGVVERSNALELMRSVGLQV